jgi:hypothetical protein
MKQNINELFKKRDKLKRKMSRAYRNYKKITKEYEELTNHICHEYLNSIVKKEENDKK